MPEVHRKKHNTSKCDLFVLVFFWFLDVNRPAATAATLTYGLATSEPAPGPDPSTSWVGPPSSFSSGSLVSVTAGTDTGMASPPNARPRLAPFLKFDMPVMLTLCMLLVLDVR